MFVSRPRRRSRNRKIGFVKPVAKQIEDEYEHEDDDEVNISAVFSTSYA